MKITPEIIKELECVLDMRKKNGEEIWPDGTELEFNIAGTFAADKFIVINKVRQRAPDLFGMYCLMHYTVTWQNNAPWNSVGHDDD